MRKLKKIRLADFSEKGVSPREYFFLSQICGLNPNPDEEKPGVQISELGAASGISRPAASQILNLLEGKGLVERISAKSDRRVVYARLTEAGALKRAEMTETYAALMDRVLSELGERDADELLRLIGKLYDIMARLDEEKRVKTEKPDREAAGPPV